MSVSRCDVLVVGAGIAGLSAARHLLLARPDLQLIVLEAKHRVGGRVLSKSVKCSDGESREWSFGPEWVSHEQTRVGRLLDELGIDTFAQFKEGKKYLELESRVIQYNGSVPDIGVLNLLDTDSTLKSLQRQASSAFKGNSDSLRRLAGESARESVERLSMRRESEIFLRGVVQAVLQTDDSNVSCLRALAVANSGGGFEQLLKEAQRLRIVGGAQAMVSALADFIGSRRLLLKRQVVQVDQTDGCVRVTTHDGCCFECDVALLTVPFAGLRNVVFEPPLSQQLRRLIAGCPSVSGTVKIVVTYHQAFWREAGLSGEILSCLGAPTAAGGTRGPISLCYDASSSDGTQPALTIVAAAGVCESPEQRKSAVLQHLARFFPAECVNDFVDFVEHDWSSEPFHSACMATAVPPGDAAESLATPQAPHGRVHFAGTDFAVSWIGFLEGAVQTGHDAADGILDALDKKY